MIVSMTDVTRILQLIEKGDPSASEQLLPLVYDELRVLASQRLRSEKPGQTLQATALVHEAYLRMVGDRQDQQWDGRGHFFSAAAEAMRRILVDSARRKQSKKRGGDFQRQDLDDDMLLGKESSNNVVELDEALSKLADEDPKVAELVKLRYFGGLTIKEAAEVLGVSSTTANKYWAFAKAWLLQSIESQL